MNASETIGETSALNAPWNDPWPEKELEELLACPVCSSPERAFQHSDLVDDVFFCAPGKWTSWRCSNCGCAYLDPRPSLATIHLAYQRYYTHRVAGANTNYAVLSPLRKLRRGLVNGYTRWRYSCREVPAAGIGAVALWALWPLTIRLGQGISPYAPPSRRRRRLTGSRLRKRFVPSGCTGLWLGCYRRRLRPQSGRQLSSTGLQERLFDVITLSHVLEHLHDPVAALKACYRLLKPGGQLWLQTPNIDSLGHRQYGQNWRGLEPPRHLALFNTRSLTLALRWLCANWHENNAGSAILDLKRERRTQARTANRQRQAPFELAEMADPQECSASGNGAVAQRVPDRRRAYGGAL